MNNLSFISNNAKGIQAILKPIKIFEYLPSKMKKYGVTNPKGSYFSLMIKPTPVVSPLVLCVQRL